MEDPVNVSKAKWLTRINTDKHTDVKFEIVIMILKYWYWYDSFHILDFVIKPGKFV